LALASALVTASRMLLADGLLPAGRKKYIKTELETGKIFFSILAIQF
jgi:hypothetical protein